MKPLFASTVSILRSKQSVFSSDPIEIFGFPDNLEKSLKRKNIFTVGKFYKLKKKRLVKIKGVGNKTANSLMAIKRILKQKIVENEVKPTDLQKVDQTKKKMRRFKITIFGEPTIPQDLWKGDPIEILNMPTRVENILKIRGITTIEDFTNCPLEKIYKFRNVGEKSLKYLADIMKNISNGLDDSDNHKAKVFVKSTVAKQGRKPEPSIPPELLVDLLLDRAGNDRPKKIIQARYGLQNGGKETLEEVGHWFGITRERVRQIQEKTLKKMQHPSTKGRSLIISLVSDTLQKNGLVISDEEADILIPKTFNNTKYDGSSFLDLLSDLGWVQRNKVGDIGFYCPKGIKPIDITKLMDDTHTCIKTSSALLSINQISDYLRGQQEKYKQYDNLDNLILRICKIDPRIEEKLPNKFGLYLFHPGTKDWCQQITEILKESDFPLHFTEISDKLNDKLALVGDKRIDVRRVHSILIESPEFSHTGVKGTYGLTEWGFRKETTTELVEECIKKAGFPLHWNQIYNYVSKYKDTKPANITAILHSQNKFIKIGRGTFGLEKYT